MTLFDNGVAKEKIRADGGSYCGCVFVYGLVVSLKDNVQSTHFIVWCIVVVRIFFLSPCENIGSVKLYNNAL